MTDAPLDRIRDLIQEDVGNRGLRTDPDRNLITACPHDFADACRSLADTASAAVGVITGFYIPHAQPPCGETDGPLGAVFLARALVPLGVRVVLFTDPFGVNALHVGLEACGLREAVPVVNLPMTWEVGRDAPDWPEQLLQRHPLTHLIALERAGPSHTIRSVRAQPGSDEAAVERFIQDVPLSHFDCCHTMKGRDITPYLAPAHRLVEAAARQSVRTIGIGDGGNEIGMGKIPWDVIRHNIPNGGRVACRVATEYLIVCGVSNWGAYGLAAGVYALKGRRPDAGLFDAGRERAILQAMVERGPLVDGVSGQPTVSVDGLSFERYAAPLTALAQSLASGG